MTDFIYPLGALVVLDPTGQLKGPIGKVVGHITWIGGGRGYFVSTSTFHDAIIQRHVVAEYEIHPAEVMQ